MIDSTDLRPMKPTEFQCGTFYLKDEKGEFVTCQIFKEELKNEERAAFLKMMTMRLALAGKLFVRINRPFKSFAA